MGHPAFVAGMAKTVVAPRSGTPGAKALNRDKPKRHD
jgi:hypothetical protein